MVTVAVGTWLAYDRVYARGGDRPVEWRDASSALGAPHFRRAAAGSFRSRGELRQFLDEEVRGLPPRLPPLDFAREQALLATVGPRSSTGYAVEVVSIREERGRLVARLRERTPRLGERVEPRVTYPFRLVAVRRTDKHVEFEWEGR